MKPAHAALAVGVSVVWGLGFVAIKLGLTVLSPAQLVAGRFLVAAAPALLFPRPQVPARQLIAIGLTLFTGQFLLLFFGVRAGVPGSVAAVVVQIHAFFTVVLAALLLAERPRPREWAGMAVAGMGLGAVALTTGADLNPLGLALVLCGALSWAVGNILIKLVPPTPLLPLILWLSWIPPLPALLVSIAADGPRSLIEAVLHPSWLGAGAVLYLGGFATVAGYAAWGFLLRTYSAAQVTPYALVAPIVGGLASSLVLGEVLGPMRLMGMGAVLAGLAIAVLPWPRFALRRYRSSGANSVR